MVQVKKIKILHILHSFDIGGLENGVVNLINRTYEIFYHEICCITRSGKTESRLNQSIKIHELHKKEGNDWRFIPRLIKVIKSAKPDIVHTRNWGTVDGIIAAKLSGVRSVIHGEHGWNMCDPQGENRRRLLMRRILSPGVNRFITVSEDIRKWLCLSAGIKTKKIMKIMNGVDTDRFFPKQPDEIRAKYGLRDEIVIGIVGRLDPIKRHDLLFQAFSKLEHKDYKLKLIVVGDGPERPKLEILRKELPYTEHIKLFGERNNVNEIYNLMDIFVLPSQNEGISNTILEAMASGLPVIATSVGGNPELVTHKKTGMLIQPDSLEAIRDSINFYLEHPDIREVHGTNARLDAVKRFSLRRMVREYEELYKTLYYTLIS